MVDVLGVSPGKQAMDDIISLDQFMETIVLPQVRKEKRRQLIEAILGDDKAKISYLMRRLHYRVITATGLYGEFKVDDELEVKRFTKNMNKLKELQGKAPCLK